MDAAAVSLGLIQGITEFLPVSSSGHLALFKTIAGYEGTTLSFDLVLHIATLLAVFLYFLNDILLILFEWCYGFFNANARRWTGWRLGWAIIAGVAVTGPVGIFLSPFVEKASTDMLWLGANFLITGALLISAKFITEGNDGAGMRSAWFVGLVQGFAVFPGISRSGSTIWAGLVFGLSREEAFRFSFILSIPTIIGASLFEAGKLGGASEFMNSLPDGWLYAAIAAFVSGFLSLVILRRLVVGAKWWAFSLYCIALGCVVVIYSMMGT
ncbi:MAG: undecaprenyl-diphosphate phosphatase [Synergistaceae bacterium]|jgi:undecaprenyl-diphosphatase|nr:undecaprenyl-diphosphate phosphatase [Synergistaceae bacterium]